VDRRERSGALRRLNLLLALAAALILPALPPPAHALTDDQLLPPDQAFAFSARPDGPDAVIAEWRIAAGYYLYRDKFRFESGTPGVTLGTPDLPKGKVKEDEFFGRVEIYRERVRIRIPVRRGPDAPRAFELVAHSQGCADLGVCYPPQRQVALLSLPAAAAPAPAAAAPSPGTPRGEAPKAQKGKEPPAALERLARSLGAQEAGGEFLPPDEAYRLSVRPAGPGLVEARWEIAEGYYLYRDKFRFEPAAEGVTVGEPRFPPAEEKDDPFFGRVQVYHEAVAVQLPVQAPNGAAKLRITYQGCAEAGLCYPPITKTVTVQVQPGTVAPATAAEAPAAQPAPARQAPVSEQDRLARFLLERPLWLSAGLFFVLGLGLAFTPCVFPMFPILSSIIVGEGQRLTTGWAFTLSMTYVLAMAVTYTVAGVIVALVGANLQAAFQDPWIIGAFAVVFVLLALSMFGFYDLQMPSAVQSRLTRLANSQRGGHLAGVAVMGFLSALIVGPCVTAPLVAALLVIAQTGDPVLGGTALFALSLGMGAPLVAAGTSAGKLLPKAGPWMDAVKAVFGVLLLAVGIWLLERVIPAWAAMLLWAALLIVSAVYMGALDPVAAGASGWRRLWKGLGWILLLWGALLIVGMAAGVRDTWQPLRGLLAGGPAAVEGAAAGARPAVREGLPFARVKGLEQIRQAVAAAAAEGRPVMMDFYADWCVSCLELEKLTFSDPGVQAELEGFQLLKVDMTPWDDQDKAVSRHYGVIGPPAILFFGPDGRERKAFRLVGFVGAAEFRDHLRRFKEAVGWRKED